MRPLLHHVQRSLPSNVSLTVSKPSIRAFSNLLRASFAHSQCGYRPSASYRWPPQAPHSRTIHQPSGGEKPRQNETPEERLARVRADIALREEQERERLEKERLERERQEKERLERERLENERLERERQERERQEKERLEREKQANLRKRTLPDVIELTSSPTPPGPKEKVSPLPHATGLSSSDAMTPLHNQTAKKIAPKGDFSGIPVKDGVEPVPKDQLPSHHHAQRWGLSKRFQKLMDDVLPQLAVVTQKVNTYTGTDYSGIEALKREIKDHETRVKIRRATIDEKKEALDTALSQQASAQKEVVALLERKHSWSDRDLERYMSLIRSEHVNDQAVREAKEAIKQAENSLEEARSQLEKRERAQYHEEQIWSDTIRRNSTWVTFGLMGLNIFLLLATMIVIEPWRRRRMVREIKNTLEAQQAIYQPAAVVPNLPAVPLAESFTAATITTPVEIEKKPELVEITPTNPIVAEVAEKESTAQSDTTVTSTPGSISSISKVTTEPMEDRPYTAPISGEQPVAVTIETLEAEVQAKPTTTFETWQEKAKYIAKDIISERTISMRRVDYTAAILQGAAAGAVITAAIVAMIIGK